MSKKSLECKKMNQKIKKQLRQNGNSEKAIAEIEKVYSD
jgi:hypothetical protein